MLRILPYRFSTRDLFLPTLLFGLTFLAILYALVDPDSSASSLFSFSSSSDPSSLYADYEALNEDKNAWVKLQQYHEEHKHGVRRASWGALRQQGQRETIRANLRDDKRYFTAWNGGGWNNEMINLINSFAPHSGHLGARPSDVAVSEIFDLNRLSAVLDDLPIVEMHELKVTPNLPDRLKKIEFDGEHPQSDQANGELELKVGDWIQPQQPGKDQMGCWSFFASQGTEGRAWSDSLGAVDASFAPLPLEIFDNDVRNSPSIVELGKFLSVNHHGVLPPTTFEILQNHSWVLPEPLPDDHVACVDMLFYFIEQTHRYNMGLEYTYGQGAWNRVGKHMRWQPALKDLGDRYLRMAFGLGKSEETPPYMAVHMRRGDFASSIIDLTPKHYAHAASEVMRSVLKESGVDLSTRVLATTDETDEEWMFVI